MDYTQHEFLTKIKQIGFCCPICNKHKSNLSQHVELIHKLSWEDFQNNYDWKEGKRFISDDYRRNLSTNKQSFYDSELGTIQKGKQSILFSKNNPGSKKENKENNSLHIYSNENNLLLYAYHPNNRKISQREYCDLIIDSVSNWKKKYNK